MMIQNKSISLVKMISSKDFTSEFSKAGKCVGKMFAGSLFVLLFLSGCTREHEVVYQLDCVINSVVHMDTEKVFKMEREYAIRNGFEYHFKVYNDGVVVVNDADVYVKDEKMERSYSLQREKRVDKNMKFQFTKAYDDVRFVLVKKKREYTYNCSNTKEMVNK